MSTENFKVDVRIDSNLILNNQTTNTVPIVDASKNVVSSSVTTTELGYLSGISGSLQPQIDAKIPLTQKGASNGVASLDAGGKVPTSQLPNSIMEFQGNWNATTNVPTLADGTGNLGDVYRVNIAGTQNLGSGSQTFGVGDWIIYDINNQWKLSHTGADAVVSVNGAAGVVTVNALNQLTGDVTVGAASGSASGVSTVAAIQGTTVSGTTGSGNVVFSASPTITGTLTTAAIAATSLNASGTVTGSNISGTTSGTNTGDVSLSSFGSTPSANGASLSGQAITLQPANATNPGGVSTTTQSFAGNKTFTGTIVASNFSGTSSGTNTGDQTITLTGDVTGSGTGSFATTIANLSVTNAKIANTTIDLTTKVTGILPIANGGTNSTTALNNNRIMQSSGSAIVEAAAITASRALASDANGIPVASATTATELGYVSGVTSAIQTQITALQPLSNKIYYVSTVGNDSNIGYSINKPFLTLSAALTAAGNSGNQVCILPGTYSGNYTISNQNVTITSANNEAGGLCNFTGTFTVSNTASSVRLNNLVVDTINHTGAGSLYISNCLVSTALSSSSSGYLEVTNSDTQGTGLAATISITGTGTKVFIGSNKVGSMTVNNASVSVNISNALTITPLTLSAGTVGIDNSVIYAATGTSNSITVTGASSLLVLNNLTSLTPTNTPARISIAAASFYNIRSAYMDKTNSTLSGTVVATATTADFITSAIYSSDAFTASRALATNASKQIVVSATTSTELGFVSGVTSAIQTQIDTKVAGVASSVDGEIALFNSTTGKIIKRATGTGFVKSTSGVFSTSSNISLTSDVTGTLPIANGGTGQTTASGAFNALSPITNTGDLIIGNGVNSATNLPIGGNNTMLTSNGTTASWIAVGANTALSNLASTAVNTNILPASANAVSLGNTSNYWANTYSAHNYLLPGNGSTLRLDANASNVTWVLTFPSTGGSNNQVLKTDGSGNTSWTTDITGNAANVTGTVAVTNGGTGQTTYTDGQLLIGNTSGNTLTKSTITAGSGISVTNGNGSITIAASGVSAGDISETSFSAANNQSSAANVTGFAFANATVRSFKALVSVVISATSSLYEVFELTAVQKGASWSMNVSSVGDDSGVAFTITNVGQIQYTSGNYTGFSSATVKFKAQTTTV